MSPILYLRRHCCNYLSGNGSAVGFSYDSAMETMFGSQLRSWRSVRGMSQLDLASRADVSQRHISFIENGRSRPSREMVIHLAGILEVPPREQNLLLTAAGHAPAYTETPLEELDEIGDALDYMLDAHEPHMAIVVDRRWDVIRANRIATRFMSALFPEPPSWATPMNVMRINFHPDGLRQHTVDWKSSATRLLRRLERDAASHPSDRELHALLGEVLDYPDVDQLQRRPRPEVSDLVVPITYRLGDDEISLFTTISIIGDAHDLTLAELRLETFWPVDEGSKKTWQQLFDTT